MLACRVQRKQTKLQQEVQRAVRYQDLKRQIADKVIEREGAMEERNATRHQWEQLGRALGEEDARVVELKAELERLDLQADVFTQQLGGLNEELLSMEAAGTRSSLDQDEMSEHGLALIQGTTPEEAQYLLKAFFTSQVRQQLAAKRTVNRIKQLEVDASVKDNLFELFLTNGLMVAGSHDGTAAGTDSARPTAPVGDAAGTPSGGRAGRPSSFSEGTRRSTGTVDLDNDDNNDNDDNDDVALERTRSKTFTSASPASMETAPSATPDAPAAEPEVRPARMSVRRRIVSAIPAPLGRLTRKTASSTASMTAAASPTPFSASLRGDRRRKLVANEAVPETIVPERRVLRKGGGLHLLGTVTGHSDEVLCVAVLDHTLVSGNRKSVV